MNDQFDEVAKDLAQSVTRRAALKKFGVGLAGVVLATLGLANRAHANPSNRKKFRCDCRHGYDWGCSYYTDSTSYSACLSKCGLVCR